MIGFILALILALIGQANQSVGLIPPSSAVNVGGIVYYCQDIGPESPGWDRCQDAGFQG